MLLNDWPEGCEKNRVEKAVIEKLYEMGNQISFDRLGKMAGIMYLIMEKGQTEDAAQLKVQRFEERGYGFPDSLEKFITPQANHVPKTNHVKSKYYQS